MTEIDADIERVGDTWYAHVADKFRYAFRGTPMGRGDSLAAAVADLEYRAAIGTQLEVKVVNKTGLYGLSLEDMA